MTKTLVTISLILMIGLAFSPSIYSQTTSISYQGSLEDEGSPANGNYNFKFRLYDSGTLGNQLGNELTRTNITVTDGIFTITNLDFGANFIGTTIWLEIDVRQGVLGEYTTLSPRQRVSSSPTSLRSLISGNAEQLGGISPNLYVRTNDPNFVRTDDPRLTDARSPTSGSPSYIQNRTSEQSSSNFRISGTGRADKLVAVSNISVGTTNTANPLFVFGNGTDVGGVNGINNVVARFRNSQSANETAISLDTASGEDSIIYFAESGASQWQMRNDSSLEELQIRKQTGSSSENFLTFKVEVDQQGDPDNRVQIDAVLEYPGGIGRILPLPAPGLCIDNITGSGFVAPCAPSSRKHKKNIENYNLGIDIIRRLRPITFNWKQNGIADFGLIAEEVAEVEPYLALFDKDKEITGVRYDRIGVVLINAINEQQTQIESQQKEIESQKETIKKHRAEFEALKALICLSNKDAEVCKK